VKYARTERQTSAAPGFGLRLHKPTV